MKRLLHMAILGSAALCSAPALAGAIDDAMRECRAGSSAADKVAACTFVVSRSGDQAVLGRAYNRRGHAYVELGKYPEAVRDFTVVIRMNPEIAGYYDNRRNALRLAGRLPEALKDADASVRLAPTYTFVLRGRADVFDDMGRQDLAIADLTRAIGMDGKDAGLRAGRAKLYAKVGRSGDALVDLSNAIALDPANAAFVKQRGLLMAGVDRAAARADLTDYLARQPGDAEAILALAALDPPPVRSAPPQSQPAPVVRSPEPGQREEAADAKRKLVIEAVKAHEDCLVNTLVELTPNSIETAPTIADVAIDRCTEHAERRISIGVAAYDMTREEAKTIVDRKVAEMRTKMITVVVTARAEANKKAGPDQGTSFTGAGLPKGQPL